MTTELASPQRSHAVLVGTRDYDHLATIPPVSANIADLAAVLTDPASWGLPVQRCLRLENASSPGAVSAALRDAAADTEELLVFYFAGHGLVDNRGDLYLALRGTDPAAAYEQSLPYDWIRRAFLDSYARHRLVILDCSYSGRAIEPMSPASVAADLATDGTCVIAAAGRNRSAVAPPGERHSAFTGELLTILHDGIPGGPDILDITTMWREIVQQQRLKNRPAPVMSAKNGGELIPFVRNRAAHTARDQRIGLDRVVAAKNAAIESADWERVGVLYAQEKAMRERLAEAAGEDIAPPPSPLGRLPRRDRSSAVIIGAAHFRDPDVPDLPSVRNNVDDLAATLTHEQFGGFDPGRVHVMYQPELGVAADIADIAERTTDTLLVYYAGHGLLPEDGDFYLSLADTRLGREPYTALRYEQLRQIVDRCPAASRVIVLDCCFAGRAVKWQSGADTVDPAQFEVDGTYVLAATTATERTSAPDGDRHSTFTGMLLRLLERGVDGGGDLIRVADMYPWLRRELRSRGLPRPQQRGTDNIGDLALVRNRARR